LLVHVIEHRHASIVDNESSTNTQAGNGSVAAHHGTDRADEKLRSMKVSFSISSNETPLYYYFHIIFHMNARENFLRAAEMSGPDWIPCSVWVTSLWHIKPEKIEDLILRHPTIFGKYEKGSINFDDFGIRRKGNTVTDEWGCVWAFLVDGLQGQVVKHPLEDWENLKPYRPPDPLLLDNVPREGYPPSPGNFKEALKKNQKAKNEGRLAVGSLPHGFMFQRLYYLRGFSNLMKDFVEEPSELKTLIDMVVDYNLKLIHRWLDAGIDLLSCGDDLGMQDRLPIHPKVFRKYLVPAYKKMFTPVSEREIHIRFHSDGHIMEIAEDLIETGVTILNIQDLVNGIDRIKRHLKGKVCLDVDIDRQKILPFGKPEDVKKHVHRIVSELNSPEGGLMITADLYPPTPLENIEALCQALEEVGGGVKY